jgi:hypothetical protein
MKEYDQQTLANFFPTTAPQRVQKCILSLHDSKHRQLIPAQAKGASRTHQTQAAAPISLFILVMQTLLHFGQRIFMG